MILSCQTPCLLHSCPMCHLSTLVSDEHFLEAALQNFTNFGVTSSVPYLTAIQTKNLKQFFYEQFELNKKSGVCSFYVERRETVEPNLTTVTHLVEVVTYIIIYPLFVAWSCCRRAICCRPAPWRNYEKTFHNFRH